MEEGESYSVALKWKKHSNYFLHLKQLNNMALYMRLKVVSARIKIKGLKEGCSPVAQLLTGTLSVSLKESLFIESELGCSLLVSCAN